MKLILLLAICLTTVQVNNEVCRLICRNDSYDTGIYIKAKAACLCGVLKPYQELAEKRMKLPAKRKPNDEKTDYEY